MTVNSNFPHHPFACHSRDWQLVGSKGQRGLNRSSSAGQKEVCLLFFCWRPKSRTLLSFWSTPGAHGGSISPLVRLTSHPRCLWASTRRSLCALKIAQSSRNALDKHSCSCRGQFSQCFIMYDRFNTVSTCTTAAFIRYGLNCQGHAEACMRACMLSASVGCFSSLGQ